MKLVVLSCAAGGKEPPPRLPDDHGTDGGRTVVEQQECNDDDQDHMSRLCCLYSGFRTMDTHQSQFGTVRAVWIVVSHQNHQPHVSHAKKQEDGCAIPLHW